MGESLGGSIAAWIASNNRPSKLVLVSTFSDIHDVLKMHGNDSLFVRAVVAVADILYDSLPIKEWISKVTSPICMIHSLDDTYIPYQCAVINANATEYLEEFIPIKGDHTTPELSVDSIERLSSFLETNICYTDIMKDLISVRENSPLCKI
jgi:hypothetical protein